jgi:hypothetical protein
MDSVSANCDTFLSSVADDIIVKMQTPSFLRSALLCGALASLANLGGVQANNSDCLTYINNFRARIGVPALSYNGGQEQCVNNQVCCRTSLFDSEPLSPYRSRILAALVQSHRHGWIKAQGSMPASASAMKTVNVSVTGAGTMCKAVYKRTLTRCVHHGT